ncbi:MAG: division/cell wall cluster transcriptional repressor MraZ [Chloroflexi bacterium]|jgi:MraZ protein|nr:division/cell wall cluster transcriptional repressor MraZ [Chloroflexota bacterium]
MFYGRSTYNIDKKGRMTVPSKYREESPDGVVVTKGLDGNLMVYAKETFDIFAESMNSISITDPNLRSFRREILGNSAELTYDSAGRILIPIHLRKLAGIEENVIIVGSGQYFEIWDLDRLEAYESSSDPEAQAKAWASLNITTTRGN